VTRPLDLSRTGSIRAVSIARSMPIGAEVNPGGGVHFRVWAPSPKTITLVVDGAEHAMVPEPEGYHSAHVATARAGSRYGYRLDGDERLLPDPASRAQPDGPQAPSTIIDPSAYRWGDEAWQGVRREGQIIYEMHVGTFTREGSWAAAIAKLRLLRDVGVSIIEMMPVAEFPGRFGWGYDGVSLFAPTRLYGTPDDLRGFIDAAHQLGIGVILDVVYNHFGPDANYVPFFSSNYNSDKYVNEWGKPVNFDGEGSAPVREFVCENAAYWVREFHFDGLRLDATQQIFDESPRNIVAELTAKARAAAGGRSILVVAENEPQDSRLVRPEPRGYGLDGVWNEDLHHAAHVTLTARNEAYYSDYTGSAQELLACFKHGFLYQGQRSTWQKKPRGAPSLDIDPSQRINFLENHDQVANSGFGRRLIELTDRARLRAMTALLLLGPGTPMLFQGQEFASSTPFLYFADHRDELAQAVAKGRREFLMQFPSLAEGSLDQPAAEATFKKCLIDWSEREENAWAVQLHRDLIALRREDPVLSRAAHVWIDGAVLTEDAFLVRLFGEDEDRLLVFNFGRDWSPRIVPEPLLAPPPQAMWRLVWSSHDPAYGGDGVREPLDSEGRWFVQGRAALVLRSAVVESA
jgi:maltooligosyltrehalose trehalohydrolase